MKSLFNILLFLTLLLIVTAGSAVLLHVVVEVWNFGWNLLAV